MNEEKMLPKTPTKIEDFTQVWAAAVLEKTWSDIDIDSNKVEIVSVEAKLNGLQGLLSTTYIVDVQYSYEGTEDTKSIFVKIPLNKDGEATYHEANTREHTMFTEVLPKLQTFLTDKCTDILQLPIPQQVYSYYKGDGKNDVFVLENLIAADYEPFKDELLTKEYLKSCLECMAQLHGTGLCFKQNNKQADKDSEKGADLKAMFPNLNEQAQIQDTLQDKDNKKSIRRNLKPFLKFLEIKDPSLSNYTNYLAKTEKQIIKILQKASKCGIDNLATLCHGDAKPDNFLFRRIEIELDDLSCEGLEAILIDWQQTFIGSVSNDLMWLLPPFLEKQADNMCSLEFALGYYFEQMKHVLESFGRTLEDFELTDNSEDFQSIIRSGFLLEFFSVIIINPIMNVKNAAGLRRWHRKQMRHEERLENGGNATRVPAMPSTDDIFPSQQFGKFANLYCKVAHILGVFPQVGKINVEIVREKMFREEGAKEEEEDNDDIYEDEEDELSDDDEADAEKDDITNPPSLPSRIYSWVLSIFGLCNKKQ